MSRGRFSTLVCCALTLFVANAARAAPEVPIGVDALAFSVGTRGAAPMIDASVVVGNGAWQPTVTARFSSDDGELALGGGAQTTLALTGPLSLRLAGEVTPLFVLLDGALGVRGSAVAQLVWRDGVLVVAGGPGIVSSVVLHGVATGRVGALATVAGGVALESLRVLLSATGGYSLGGKGAGAVAGSLHLTLGVPLPG